MSTLNWRRANADARMRRHGVETFGSSRGGRRLPPRKTPRSTPRAPKLASPVIVSEFWANRRGESVRVQFREYEGCLLVDVRKHYTAADGKLTPTSRGIAITIRRLPELAAALAKAELKARELGLLE